MTDISESGIELLPCPFCGATAHRGPTKQTTGQDGKSFQRYAIWCPHGHSRFEEMTAEQTVEAWNRRHPPASREEGLREALAAIKRIRADDGVIYSGPVGGRAAALNSAEEAIETLIPTKPEAKEQEDALYENLSRAELADTVARYGKALSEIANFSPKSDGFSAPTETAAFCQERARSALQSKKPE